MPSRNRICRVFGAALVVLAASALAGCSLDKQEMPALSGPSEFALSFSMTATPDSIPRDGSSQSVVTITTRDVAGRPVVGQQITLSLGSNAPTGVTLSQSQVVTGSTGQATFIVTAPASGSTGNILITATPVGTNGGNDTPHTLQILATPQNGTAPTAAFSYSPSSPDVGQTVTFNASTTRDEGVSCTSCSFFWDFGGDGTATGLIATHAFSSGGSFVVTLTATDSGGTSNTTQQTVTVTAPNIPTSVSISSSPATPIASQPATFTASATAATNHRIVSYQFIWGDGNSNSQNANVIQHTYSQAGTYLLTLTVRDDLGQSTTINQVLTVSSGLTISAFTANPASPAAGQTTTFSATATSNVASTITDYAWDFDGDGTYDANGSSSTTTYAYPSSGTFTAKVRVTDSRGVTETKTLSITVTP